MREAQIYIKKTEQTEKLHLVGMGGGEEGCRFSTGGIFTPLGEGGLYKYHWSFHWRSVISHSIIWKTYIKLNVNIIISLYVVFIETKMTIVEL